MSPTHWLIAIGVFVLLFGAGRLPETARSLGRSVRILRAKTSALGPSGGNDHPEGDGAEQPPRA